MRWWWQPPCLLRMVILNLKDDPTVALKGLLWNASGPWLTLRQVTMLRAGQETPADGDVIVHRDNVSFLQVP